MSSDVKNDRHLQLNLMTRSNNLVWNAWLAFLDKVSDLCFYQCGCREKVFMEKVNFTVTASTACFILYTQCAGVIYFTTGAVFCSLSVKVVKRIIRQPRPPNLPGRKLKISYGCVTKGPPLLDKGNHR